MRQASACTGSTLLVDKSVSEPRVRAGAADSVSEVGDDEEEMVGVLPMAGPRLLVRSL